MEFKATIDRFEGSYAVLLVGKRDETLDWPKSMLPTDAREGDVVLIHLTLDKKERQARDKRVKSLLDKLTQKNQG
ncbi:DUF3006 domain-containing protein [Heliorestis convoluta]|uniref:DUF3006 domain-containing protein n=1 Tax=Heliorestis convoluta TaxID=356322 RepID=A0A5Q2N3Y4_9FIRM|nr:DUF3006 domain-containing protein [Heliorestis convoluta]QGG48306.1 hypothetical protein FTV88_2208 [Heliorestis convoluta]